MIKNCLILLTVLITFNISIAQNFSNEEQEVYNVVVKLFDGMRAGDSSIVHSVFSDDCRMFTNFVDAEGVNQNREGSLSNFLKAIGTPHDQVWDEKIWNTTVDVELGVASCWTEYAFFAGENFSHCGIDAFQLLKENGDWKIIQIIDTRRKDDCDLPDFNK